jgi:hypothetical protein
MPGVPFPWTLGEAVKIDGTWKVSGQTWCGTVRMSGVMCPPEMWDPSAPRTHFGG